jgi:hypothetical protein
MDTPPAPVNGTRAQGRVDHVALTWGRLYVMPLGAFAHFSRSDWAGPWPPPIGATVTAEIITTAGGRVARRVQL